MGSDDLIKILGPGVNNNDLKPFPSTLMKGCIAIILPMLTKSVNISLQTATMPERLKEALIKPKLKKEPSTLNIILISDQIQI